MLNAKGLNLILHWQDIQVRVKRSWDAICISPKFHRKPQTLLECAKSVSNIWQSNLKWKYRCYQYLETHHKLKYHITNIWLHDCQHLNRYMSTKRNLITMSWLLAFTYQSVWIVKSQRMWTLWHMTLLLLLLLVSHIYAVLGNSLLNAWC